MIRSSLLVLAGVLSLGAQASEPLRGDEGIGYYVAVDSLATIASGTYAGQANPNYGRLTVLFDHGNHFHGIGTYSYTGPGSAPVVNGTNANNRIPETYTLAAPLPLTPGSGSDAGLLVSSVLPEAALQHEYSYLGLSSIQSLAGNPAGSERDVLFNSSSGRWNGTLDNVSVALKLESITPGLKVAANGDADLFDTGNLYLLGAGNSFDFLPVFWTAADAAPGTYSAQFSLVNLGSNLAVRDSGTFHFDFAVAAPVPEPGTWAMLLGGLFMIGLTAARRAR
ncbi:MAG: all3515 family Zur-repressed PEP-CTERM protein [Methyloversatilis sp.]|uniref:all3515 family Zur-repressed PEP-CTERM protein n=1 Tax=Methyloversatilis sp. TaxID=2569862 RepID=UPI002735915D|nr:all3515 family Zur-repressed PEP-CTERM protein [Methyloversatilis sp.]MDP3873480.1 all3515 family Zur-repressed PEP-CTERM protein [Methyloversatilis sp.]